MGYVTLQEYKDYMFAMVNKTGQVNPRAEDDAFLNDLINSATEFIESETKRRFQAATLTKLYDSRSVVWNDRQLLLLDDELLEVTTLTNANGEVIPNGDFFLEPLNKMPAWGIRLKTGRTWSYSLDGRISVLGSWGRMVAPNEDVKRITCRLAYIFQQRRTATGDVEVVGTGAAVGGTLKYGSYIPSDVRDWLRRHSRQTYGGR